MHLAIYYKHQNGIPAEIKVMKPDYLALVEQEYDITCVEKLIAETGVLIPATARLFCLYTSNLR